MVPLKLQITLRDLVTHTITRTRGQEATEALFRRASDEGASEVELHMVSNDVISTSFVDEIVQQAFRVSKAGGPTVTFVIPDQELVERFQKSATWRNISCRYRFPDDVRVRTIRPGKTPDLASEACLGTKEQIHTQR